MTSADAAALAIVAAVAVIAAVAVVLAILNRRARHWRFGVFYERDDDHDK